jgi:TonB-dependent SusC/RagA subfamily outer membrane receptor
VDVSPGGYGGVVGGIGAYGQLPGRFNDYNPQDNESIEVVKGAAAATLYGSDGANGVIVIKTKRGQPGRPKWNAYAEQGALWIPLSVFPDNYFSWGHTPAGVPRQCKLMDMYVDKLCTIDSLGVYNVFKDREQSPMQVGNRENWGVQLSGGVREFRYFISTGYEHEVGVLKMPEYSQRLLSLEREGAAIPDEQIYPNTMRKFDVRGNSSASFGDKGEALFSVGLLKSETRLPSQGSVYNTYELGLGLRTACGGWYSCTTPAELFAVRNTDNTTHLTGSVSGGWRPVSALAFRGSLGHDFAQSFVDDLQRRNEGPFGASRDGRRQNIKVTTELTTADIGGSWTANPRRNVSSRTSFGAQYNSRLTLRSSVTGTGLPPGRSIVTGAATLNGSEVTSENKTAGAYAEQKFG